MIYEMPNQDRATAGLEDYLSAIRKRWPLVVLVTIMFIVLAVLFNRSRTSTYAAEAKVVVNPTIANAPGGNLVNPQLEREKEIIASNGVATIAAELVGDTTAAAILQGMNVQFVNRSDALSVTYTSTNPERAAEVVNAVVDSYVELREQASLSVYESEITSLQRELTDLNDQSEQLSRDIGRAQSQRTFTFTQPASDARQAQIDELNEELNALNAERNAVSNSVTTATRELRKVERDRDTRNTTAEVLKYATPPTVPAGPSATIITAMAVIAGFGFGVASAFLFERLDRTAREAADVEAAIGASVLGSIPKFGWSSARQGLVMTGTARSPRAQSVREAYRRLRASLFFLQSTRNVKSFVITSAHPSEGKSVTAANIAIAAAQSGQNVVIVSADLRRPSIERLLGVSSETGLADYLSDQSASDILIPVPDIDGLVLMPSGMSTPNPSELLGSKLFSELIEDLSSQFDLVLIDMPPILSTADAGAASFHADGVIVVVDAQRTDTNALLRVRTTLERSGGEIVGAILNKDNSDSSSILRRDRYAYHRVAAKA